jgi:hypothetical protein
MTRFEAKPHLAELKGFQRDAVEHAMERLYAPGSSRRFLIADETGLGKSIVARGIVARTIERLQHDKKVDRIDIVYVCSSTDLARQNLRRLDVTGNRDAVRPGRLTLLALDASRLQNAPLLGGKPVNLISFTPGTSFDNRGHRTGAQEERALLHLLMMGLGRQTDERELASLAFFQAGVTSIGRFRGTVRWMHDELGGRVDARIRKGFATAIRANGQLDEFRRLLKRIMRSGHVPQEIEWDVRRLTGQLRHELARASIDTLEPDLIILDEFQRFRHLLLDVEQGGEAAELADDLFSYENARVLLLSATPYKPYTDAAVDGDESHYDDLMKTLGFLSRDDSAAMRDLSAGFGEYHHAMLRGIETTDAVSRLQGGLLRIMSRTERPRPDEQPRPSRIIADATAGEFLTFARLDAVARRLGAPITPEYWKSIPHFVNFMQEYAVSRRLDEALAGTDDAELRAIVLAVPGLKSAAITGFLPADLGSGKLRALADQVISPSLWKLLWLPPSMRYWKADGPYAEEGVEQATKRLIFSSWSAAPTAIASLLSFEVDRRIAEGSRLTEYSAEARRGVRLPLPWAMDGDRPASMSTLALFWPHPVLAKRGDPLHAAQEDPTRLADSDLYRQRLDLELQAERRQENAQAWEALFTGEVLPRGLSRRDAIALYGEKPSPDEDDDSEGAGRSAALDRHLELALSRSEEPEGWHADLALLAIHGPGNIAWRALGRLRRDGDDTTDRGQWLAAVRVSEGLRSLFNRLESNLLLDQLYESTEAYWRRVLRYCAAGDLQATLDEYVFQLRSESANGTLTDETLALIAEQVAIAVTMRPSSYRARDPLGPDAPLTFSARFAVRYGGRATSESANDPRMPEARKAFNSPFWPFVLASTSVGQEGIDFHWWCHAIVHWNLPGNPVDLEQREGRVDRFAGHAIRKNVAAGHRQAVLADRAADPWGKAFELAAHTHPELGDFAPYWSYPGEAHILRQTIDFPLSRDIERAERLRSALGLYRLTLGGRAQPELLERMEQLGITAGDIAPLDLRPPQAQRK